MARKHEAVNGLGPAMGAWRTAPRARTDVGSGAGAGECGRRHGVGEAARVWEVVRVWESAGGGMGWGRPHGCGKWCGCGRRHGVGPQTRWEAARVRVHTGSVGHTEPVAVDCGGGLRAHDGEDQRSARVGARRVARLLRGRLWLTEVAQRDRREHHPEEEARQLVVRCDVCAYVALPRHDRSGHPAHKVDGRPACALLPHPSGRAHRVHLVDRAREDAVEEKLRRGDGLVRERARRRSVPCARATSLHIAAR
eukprot:2958533-Prymnesium_polylepis.1